MSETNEFQLNDPETIREILSGSGYSEKAIEYYIDKKNMGSLPDADQVSELTGHCGDTMKIFLKLKDDKIKDARIQVLGCPGAVASAMVAMDMIRGKSLDEAMKLKDGDIFRELEDLPDQKQHCIRLTNKTIQKAIEEYRSNNGKNRRGD
jgi:nitrogen fixation NifU-like protein